MTPQELRNSILLRAVQGKITNQNKEDGDTRDLLPKLHLDKAIKPNDPPFDIPDNWMWIPIGSLGESTDTDSFCDGPFGSNLKSIHYIQKPEVRIIQLSNIGETGWKNSNVKYTSYEHLETVIPRCEVFPGDFVIAKMMPAGRTIEVPNLGTRITLGSDAMKFVPNSILNKQYLLYAMASQAFLEQVYAEAHGITRVRTTLKGVKSYVLPIPPLAEQKRIVSKIEELIPLVAQYEKAYNRLKELDAKFPEDMKKSILQMAIQGKLVEQRPEEGTGEELYKQIQAEKATLIKEGKIKKEKSLLPVPEDEVPFDIPESWRWVFLNEIASSSLGKTINKTSDIGDLCPYLCSINVYWEGINLSTIKQTMFTDEEKRKYSLKKGDLLICEGGDAGRCSIWDNDQTMYYQNALHRVRFYYELSAKFYKSVLELYKSNGIIKKHCKGETIKHLVQNELYSIPFPLPPLAEQKRIVAKIEELLPLCEMLKK